MLVELRDEIVLNALVVSFEFTKAIMFIICDAVVTSFAVATSIALTYPVETAGATA